jgi:hypothetical protein
MIAAISSFVLPCAVVARHAREARREPYKLENERLLGLNNQAGRTRTYFASFYERDL